MTEESKIIFVDVKKLQAHPRQEYHWGLDVDPEFVDSIKNQGVMEPIIITPTINVSGTNPKFKYVIISGYCRWMASKEAKFDKIPAIIEQYESQEKTYFAFLNANQKRPETESQKRRQFLAYLGLLKTFATNRQSKGLSYNPIYDDNEFSTAVETLKIEDGKPLNSVEILMNLTGYSERQQKYMKVIWDNDFMQEKFDWWHKISKWKFDEKEIYDQWMLLRAQAESGVRTKKYAFDEISRLIAGVNKKYAPKERVKSEKLKVEKKEKPCQYISKDGKCTKGEAA